MFSNWTTQAMRLGWVLILTAAVVAFVPWGSARPQQEPAESEAAESNPTVDDVLDEPQDYVGQEVTLQGEIDHIYSPTTFAIEDDQDLFGEDQILVVSVMPVATRPAATNATKDCCADNANCPHKEATRNCDSTSSQSTRTTTTTTSSDLSPIPAVEVVQLHDGEWDEGKLVSATGTICMFDRAALEQQFGTIDWGSAPLDTFEGQPVLVIGAQQYTAMKQRQAPEELAVVIIEEEKVPEPAPAPPPVVEPAPEPAPIPEAAPEPTPAPMETLPRTASPLSAIGLTGLLSLLAGFGFRKFRS